MKYNILSVFLTLLIFVAAGLGYAFGSGMLSMDHGHHTGSMCHHMPDGSMMGDCDSKEENPTPSTRAFMEVNNVMHRDMNIAFSGDADNDFVRGMIPHHQGAVDMAKVLLEYGTDPDLQKLGQEIIAAQEVEIAFMEQWLAANAQ